MKRICIFGAGAVGGHIAAKLARAGVEVSIVTRGEHLAAIQRNGLRFMHADGEFTVPVAATDDPHDLGPQDLVVTTAKAYALPEAAFQLRSLLGPETPVLFVVNGIPWWYLAVRNGGAPSRLDPVGSLLQEVGLGRTLGGVIRSPNEVIAPGTVRHNGKYSALRIGEIDNSRTPRLEAVAEVLRKGIPDTESTSDLSREIWSKLTLNIPSSLLSTLTGSTSPELFADSATRDLYERLAQEVCATAARYDTHVRFDLEQHLNAISANRHLPSMLQDLISGRRLEIDAQLFAVQDLARQARVDTPLIDVMLALLARKARVLNAHRARVS